MSSDQLGAERELRDRRLREILDRLRSAGGRITTARRAVVEALVDAADHVTAEDLTLAVQSRHSEVHASTVYRTLDALESLDIVDHVHLGHGRAVFHLADDPHQHLVCEGCGLVIEVPDRVLSPLARALRDQYDFTLRPNHFALVGRCGRCA